MMGAPMQDPVQIESNCSTLIKLEEEEGQSEGESLDSKVLQAIMHQVRHRRNSTNGGFSKTSQQLAESLLKGATSVKDSTEILARQIETLKDMELENEQMAT